MIKWCAYCQRFQGEVAPFEENDFSHGLCPACVEIGFEWTAAQSVRIKTMTELNARFWKAGMEGDLTALDVIATEGLAEGCRPIDMLFCFAGTALVKVGELWAKSCLSVQDEHRFTAACEAFIGLLASQCKAPQNIHPLILLANVESNVHDLGLQFMQLGLASIGLKAAAVPVGALTRKIVECVKAQNVATLGLSISMPEQLPLLRALLDALSDAKLSPKIIVGGWAVKSGQITSKDLPSEVALLTPNFSSSDVTLFNGS